MKTIDRALLVSLGLSAQSAAIVMTEIETLRLELKTETEHLEQMTLAANQLHKENAAYALCVMQVRGKTGEWTEDLSKSVGRIIEEKKKFLMERDEFEARERDQYSLTEVTKTKLDSALELLQEIYNDGDNLISDEHQTKMKEMLENE